jgi:regulator of RNase E activity RraA
MVHPFHDQGVALMTAIDPSQLKPLSSAILSDIMDSLGLVRRAMKPFVRPLDERHVMVGRARTGLYMPAYALREGENPYEVEIALVDDLHAQDVVVLACNGPTERIAPWGELLSTGCVTDGLVRDVRQIREMDFPVFHGGIGPLDTKGRARMVDRDVRVECGGVSIDSGDLIFGDVDGIVVIPRSHEHAVMDLALEKVKGENHTRDALLTGESLASVFKRLGIL